MARIKFVGLNVHAEAIAVAQQYGEDRSALFRIAVAIRCEVGAFLFDDNP